MAKISDEAYEELQLILEKQYQQAFMLEEVKEIGDGLVGFFNLLITLKDIEKEE
jgi:hypothetical protein